MGADFESEFPGNRGNADSRKTASEAIAAIVRKAIDGDKQDFWNLLEEQEKKLRLVILRILSQAGQEESPENILADTRVRVLNNLHAWRDDGKPDSFERWIYRIACNVAQSHLRRAGKLPKQFPVDAEGNDADFPEGFPTPGTEAARDEQIELVRKAISSMPEKYRIVVKLRMATPPVPYAEIARRLEIRSERAAITRHSRALQWLRENAAIISASAGWTSLSQPAEDTHGN